MKNVYMITAKRSAVVPRNVGFAHLDLHHLAKPVLKALLSDVTMDQRDIDGLIMGNALYGGGNPARLVALAAGFPEDMPAFTVDTQCCSGLDAIALAAQKIMTDQADVMIAGGAESYSRSPRRFKRSLDTTQEDQEYLRPPFSPWIDRDPDMLASAAGLARHYGITREAQEEFAIHSHQKAIPHPEEIVEIAEISKDAFHRKLSAKLCQKLPLLEGDSEYGLTSATTAVEADAAAFVILVSEDFLKKINYQDATRLKGMESKGCDPATPALAPIVATESLLQKQALSVEAIDKFEIMEAFAVQAILYQNHFGIPDDKLNCRGGALSRGHPIGASGAINAVRLWYELNEGTTGTTGLAAIAAAGGLGAALLMEAL